jgi:hypothetical protein
VKAGRAVVKGRRGRGDRVGMSRSSTLSVLELLHEADSEASNLGRAGLARTNGRPVSLVIRPS